MQKWPYFAKEQKKEKKKKVSEYPSKKAEKVVVFSNVVSKKSHFSKLFVIWLQKVKRSW